MKSKRAKVLEWPCPILFLVFFLLGAGYAEAQTIGKTIDKSNYQEYESMLIAPHLRWAQNGEWTFPTGNLKFPWRHTDRFLSASEKNAGKFDVDEKGILIEKATGKYPEHNVYGMPFAKIDPKDPKAGVKIMWNFKFMNYRFMGWHEIATLKWVGKTGGEERYFASDVYTLHYQGQPPGNEIKNNPQKFLYQDMGSIREPMDLKNTNTLSWEYQDERDSTIFNYIAVIRRVRRTSGAARSDPFMGTDSWWDAKDNWGGKNPSFTWKLLGERMFLEPFTTIEKQIVQEEPDGSIHVKAVPRWGFQTPGWKGAPWAYTNVTWVPRMAWVVEGIPKDPYYAWGKHIFYLEKETYHLPLKEVFDRAGEFQHLHSVTTAFYETTSGNNNAGQTTSMTSIDTKAQHATAIPVDRKLFLPLSKLAPDFFTMSNFLQLSK